MAANRPRRHKPEIPVLYHDNDKWSLIEKRRYQRALLKYSPLEVEKISKCVQTKSAKEVKAYLELMEKKVKKKECSIVQDLLHGLVDTIRTSDTSKQQEIMINKYHLLTSKIDINNTMLNVKRCRKAVNNDFSDFEKAGNDPCRPRSPILIDESPPVYKKKKGESTPVNKRKRGRPMKRISTSSETAPADKEPEDQLSTSQNSESDRTDKISDTPGKKGLRKGSIPLPGPSGDGSGTDNSQDPNLKMQNKSDQKVTETLKSTAKRGQSPKATTNAEGDSSKEKSLPPSTNQNQLGPSGETSFSSSAANENGQDEVDGSQNEDIPKKPSLFTLNPFCIPIDLIRFNPLVSSTVVFNQVKKNLTPIPGIVPKTQRNERQKKDGEVDVICMNEKKHIIGREKFISIIRTSMNDDD